MPEADGYKKPVIRFATPQVFRAPETDRRTPAIKISLRGKDDGLDDEHDVQPEEHIILRMMPGEAADELKQVLNAGDVDDNLQMIWRDQRHAVLTVKNRQYDARLVELPCIVESLKTLDNRQMYKIADICQMLVVEGYHNKGESRKSRRGNASVENWPDGLTPPLKYIRKRRFRKRVSKSVGLLFLFILQEASSNRRHALCH